MSTFASLTFNTIFGVFSGICVKSVCEGVNVKERFITATKYLTSMRYAFNLS